MINKEAEAYQTNTDALSKFANTLGRTPLGIITSPLRFLTTGGNINRYSSGKNKLVEHPSQLNARATLRTHKK